MSEPGGANDPLSLPATAARELPWPRWSLAASLILAEYLGLSLLYDVRHLQASVGWLGSVGSLAPLALVAASAVLILARVPSAAAIGRLAAALRPLPALVPWLGLHAVSVAAFFLLSHRLLTPGAQTPSAVLVLGWALAGLGLVFTALGMALPRSALGPLAALAGQPLAIGLGAGVAAWLAGFGSEALWPWLSSITLKSAAVLLAPVAGATLYLDPSQNLLGMEGFVVEVSAVCSGAEGIGLLLVLTTAYLVRFRSQLRFPQALVVLPMGVLAAFLANLLRIALLVLIGARVSEDVALGGFHSKAGWVLDCAIAIALLAWVRRSRLTRHEDQPALAYGGGRTDNPTALYLVPLLVSLALTLVTGLAMGDGFDGLYWVRVLGTGLTLLLFRSEAAVLRGRISLAAVAVGVGVFVLWLPLANQPPPTEDAAAQAGFAALSPTMKIVWAVFRVIGAVVVTPLVEEIAFRGYLMRRLLHEEFWSVDLRTAARRPAALLISAVLFGALHGSFLAGTLAGLAYGLVLLRRGKLIDAVVAHAITNGLLILWYLLQGRWASLS